jgi:hypothetical protein
MEQQDHSLNELLQASPEVLTYPLDEELVLYEAPHDRTFILNATGRMVWERCDGAHNVQAIAWALAQGFGRAYDEVLADVREVVLMLQQAGLLASGGEPPQAGSLPEAGAEDEEIIRMARRFRQLTSGNRE